MKNILSFLVSISLFVMIIMGGAVLSYGQVTCGEKAPVFSLKDASGKSYDLSEMKEQPMVILYFFDVESRPSQEGLLNLDQLAKQYEDEKIILWGITLSSKDKVVDFTRRTRLHFPALLDNSNVSKLYRARLILPTICILGPDLRVLDHFQGGGKTTEIMLMKLAERQLSRKRTKLVTAIGKQIEKASPQNINAKAIQGYAALKEGNFDVAEDVFENLSKEKGQGEVLGKEGLASVYAKKGKDNKALMLAEEVEKKDADRGYVNVIKGNIYFSQNKKAEAEEQYQEAIRKGTTESYQKAVAFNQLGRVWANKGDYEKARTLYDRAIDLDPYYIEATSNKGVSYEKEGKWGEALGAYNKALSLDKNDTFSTVLAKKAGEMMSLQRNIAEKKRIDQLVKDLAARYRSRKKSWLKTEDTWTSRPMVLSFIEFQEKGGLSERAGFSTVFTTQLGDYLNASGRVKVVERIILEQLLEELNLGSSELSDSETALKLGKVLAAKVIATGSLYNLPNGTMLNMRLIDTETSAIPKVVTRQFNSSEYLGKDLHKLNRELLRTIIEKYPLKGYVVQITGGRVLINLGAKHGVVLGSKFEVLEEQEPIKYKGKLLRSSPKTIAQIEVKQVEPDLCYADIIKQERTLNRDDKVKEKIDAIVAMGENGAIN